jgi:maltose alpha-D-glucosyltransferase/alpha-amylase
MLEVRRQHPVFGTGSFEVVSTDNPSVLAYVRSQTGPASEIRPPAPGAVREFADAEDEEAEEVEDPIVTDTVLCVCNLSRFAQPAELPLQRWEGKVPVELIGQVPFPRVGELPYFVTLGSHGFYWFELTDGPD